MLELSEEGRLKLRRRVRASAIAKRDHVRAEITLLRSEGLSQKGVAERPGLNMVLVNRWCQRFEAAGLDGLRDQAGGGRRPSVPAEKIEKILAEAGRAQQGCGRWSTGSMAREVGVSRTTVHRVWRQNDLKPHLRRTSKRSNDARFTEKSSDVIGLYLDPPERALVRCRDEKSQCQAFEPTQPGLRLGIGHIRTHTHDGIGKA
jgi:transposase